MMATVGSMITLDVYRCSMTAFDGYIGSMTALIAIGALYLHLIYGSMITFDKLGFILAFAG